MLFAISIDDTSRAILDSDLHGDPIAVIEADDWQEARGEALKQSEMDPYNYVAGHGWFKREGLKDAPLPGDNK